MLVWIVTPTVRDGDHAQSGGGELSFWTADVAPSCWIREEDHLLPVIRGKEMDLCGQARMVLR